MVQLKIGVWYQHNVFVHMLSKSSAVFAVAKIPLVHRLIVFFLCSEGRHNNDLCVRTKTQGCRHSDIRQEVFRSIRMRQYLHHFSQILPFILTNNSSKNVGQLQ